MFPIMNVCNMTRRADMQESESLHNNAICQTKYNRDDKKKKKYGVGARYFKWCFSTKMPGGNDII